MNIDTIIKPIISEKSLKEGNIGRYSFLVAKSASKTNVKEAIEKMFEVKVLGVHTNIVKGTREKMTRFGRKKTSFSYKKARVQLEKGQKIDIFEEKGV